jgi:hypothetical protein
MDKITQLFCNCYFTNERIIISYMKRQSWILFITSAVMFTDAFVSLQKLVYVILIYLYIINFAIFMFKHMKFYKETKKKLSEIDNRKK